MTDIRERVRQSWRKNRPEILALCSGRLRCLLSAPLPAFVFHSVEPKRFEDQLRFLTKNAYSTVTGERLLEILQGKAEKPSKNVVLTFDDATGSFWATAYPLLKKYGFQAILFAIPGLVPKDTQHYPNLDDVWEGRANTSDILQRESMQPLCTWRELQLMHESGVVDIQSHSMTHSRVFVKPELVDFLHPDFDTDFYGNVNIPVTQSDLSLIPVRALRLGQPIYRSASRLSGRPRYFEVLELSKKMIAYVNTYGGPKFFENSRWRKELKETYRQFKKVRQDKDTFESPEDTALAMRGEMMEAKTLLEQKIPGKIVQHFCFPWYEGSGLSDAIAFGVGYKVVYYGFEARPSQAKDRKNFPLKVSRIPDEFLCCLPGKDSESVPNAWIQKVWRVCRKRMNSKPFYTSADS
jgi:hypothetical protein